MGAAIGRRGGAMRVRVGVGAAAEGSWRGPVGRGMRGRSSCMREIIWFDMDACLSWACLSGDGAVAGHTLLALGLWREDTRGGSACRTTRDMAPDKGGIPPWSESSLWAGGKATDVPKAGGRPLGNAARSTP